MVTNLGSGDRLNMFKSRNSELQCSYLHDGGDSEYLPPRVLGKLK